MHPQKKLLIEQQLIDKHNGVLIDLSNEALSISDYEWLGNVIEKAIYLETIFLPDINESDAEIILPILNKATIKHICLTKLDFKLVNCGKHRNESITHLLQQLSSRLNRNKNRIFAIHGGGNIGLGLLGEIISKSDKPFRIIATSSNIITRNIVNSSKRLYLQHDTSGSAITCIEPISMIPRDKNHILKLYQQASLVAICVTADVMKTIAKDIAAALIKRYEQDGSGLKVLILMNLPDCANFAADIIGTEIMRTASSEALAHQVLSAVEFIPTVIDRIVTPIPAENISRQIAQQLGKLDISPPIDTLLACPEQLTELLSKHPLQINLFYAEKNFSFHTLANFGEAVLFPGIKITTDLCQIEAMKNKYINGPHAILAWLGGLLGCATIAEAINHPAIFNFIKELMENEIAPILMKEYPDISIDEMRELESRFFERCKSSTHDPIVRVGRDPLRKLNRGERIRGTLEIARKHQLTLATPRLAQGIAAGFLYALRGIDKSNPGCQQIMNIFNESNRSLSAVLCYEGCSSTGSFSGLNYQNDARLINHVIQNIIHFNKFLRKPDAKTSSRSSTLFTFSHLTMQNIPKTLFTVSDTVISKIIIQQQSSAANLPIKIFRLWQRTDKIKPHQTHQSRQHFTVKTALPNKKAIGAPETRHFTPSGK